MLFLLLFLFVGASFVEEADIFGINGQIVHKLAFLKKYVPKETRLVLLGHSIGCYIILDMMKRNPELQVSGNIFQVFQPSTNQHKAPLMVDSIPHTLMMISYNKYNIIPHFKLHQSNSRDQSFHFIKRVSEGSDYDGFYPPGYNPGGGIWNMWNT